MDWIPVRNHTYIFREEEHQLPRFNKWIKIINVRSGKAKYKIIEYLNLHTNEVEEMTIKYYECFYAWKFEDIKCRFTYDNLRDRVKRRFKIGKSLI
jgi:hypothetical protein